MTDMSGNKFFTAAQEALGFADEFDAPPEEWKAMVATHCAGVVATLALAHEQRTANLIALTVHMARSGRMTDAYEEEIATRLGLDGAL